MGERNAQLLSFVEDEIIHEMGGFVEGAGPPEKLRGATISR